MKYIVTRQDVPSKPVQCESLQEAKDYIVGELELHPRDYMRFFVLDDEGHVVLQFGTDYGWHKPY